MTHPAKILEELRESKPNASIDHWVFGIYNSSRCKKTAGLKGLLAASGESLIFKSGRNGEESHLIEVSFDEVSKVEAQLTGTVNVAIHFTDGGHMEMSYISRGNVKEFVEFLKKGSGNSKDRLITLDQSE